MLKALKTWFQKIVEAFDDGNQCSITIVVTVLIHLGFFYFINRIR